MKEETQNALADTIGKVIGLIIGVVICFLLGSCKTKQIYNEVYLHDTITFSKLQRDSIYMRDSIYVREYMRGDTVYIDKDRWHTAYKDRLVTDTLYVTRTNYIKVTTKEKMPWWKELIANFGLLVIVALIAIVMTLVIIITHRRESYEQETRNT